MWEFMSEIIKDLSAIALQFLCSFANKSMESVISGIMKVIQASVCVFCYF